MNVTSAEFHRLCVYFDARFLSLSVVLQPTEIVFFSNIFPLLRVQRKDCVGRMSAVPDNDLQHVVALV